jgi:prepilin-type N-terminal cleavage/methylation domain-containing protein/prepilin-type processing-associated H-X9-DG protein
MTMANRRHPARAFTLIELLVVIAIIALLLGILLPSLGTARDTARNIKCKVNMRSINLAMELYREDNKGFGNEHTNQGARFDLAGRRLSADDPLAYWGIPYDDYINDALEVWQDPKFQMMDPYPYYSTDTQFIFDTQRYQTYGINAVFPGLTDTQNPNWKTGIWGIVNAKRVGRGGVVVNVRTPMLRPTYQLAQPNELIIFQDAWEHALDNNGDTLNRLAQYDGDYGGYFRQVWRDEYFRHADRCNASFADGHVEEFSRSDVTDAGKPELLFHYTGNYEDREP